MSAGPTPADPFDRRPDAEGPVVALEPGLRRVTCPNPSPMTFTGTRTYIVGRGEVAVVDPGPEHPGHLEAILAALEPGERVSHIVLTHTHIDHSPGVPALKARTGASTWAFGAHGAGRSERMKALAASGAELGGGEGGDRSFTPDHLLADGERLEGAGWAMTAIHTPGHISNHLAFAVEAEGMAPGAVLSGDHVMGWNTTIVSPPDGNMREYMNSLRVCIGRDESLYLPGHGPEITNTKSFVRAYLNHRSMREGQIAIHLKNGANTIPELVRRMYAHLPKEMHGAAARSVQAHMEHMVATKRAECDGPVRPHTVFAPGPAGS